MEIPVELFTDVGEQTQLVRVLPEKRRYDRHDKLGRIRHDVDKREGGKGFDLVAFGELRGGGFRDCGQRGDEVEIAFGKRRIEYFERARSVLCFVLMRDELVAVSTFFDRVGRSERRQGIV